MLDPTPNPRLSELAAKFIAKGGEAHIGEDAWLHLQSEAGDVMSRFIKNYVRVPISVVAAYEKRLSLDTTLNQKQLNLLNFEASVVNDGIELRLGSYTRRIKRVEDETLAEEPVIQRE